MGQQEGPSLEKSACCGGWLIVGINGGPVLLAKPHPIKRAWAIKKGERSTEISEGWG